MNSAELCRANGWSVGTILEGRETFHEWWVESRIRITAIGEEKVLARELVYRTNGNPVWQAGSNRETGWSLEDRDWKAVEEQS